MKIDKYLRESPVFAVNTVYESVVTGTNRRLQKEKLNLLQGLLLTALLFEETDAVTPSQLAQTFRTSRGNISHALSRLEERGHIKRAVDPKDARRFHLLLKPEGKRTALRLVKFFDSLQDFMEERMGVQQCRRTAESLELLHTVFSEWSPPKV